MAANSIPPGSPHVRPMGVHRTGGEPDEIKKNTHPENNTVLFREQASGEGKGSWMLTHFMESDWLKEFDVVARKTKTR